MINEVSFAVVPDAVFFSSEEREHKWLRTWDKSLFVLFFRERKYYQLIKKRLNFLP